ncbi:hypothetical protein [Hyalangium minutum]|uniref:NAD-dependent protein deacetylase of SIR2 family protein n=1 Tax=Hyalangium minutum TaxID=394096 RepID=A0A085WFA3_9BACT|nr:hypothetical protein [Hyalangium minutum]KFE66366.1 NAD-dependent protein deacetylase of SIR2 family protein [Hyalangium minutum]
MSQTELRRAAEAIRSADALLIGAGAGMGVDSGLPDFRGNEGFWKAYPAYAKLGLDFASMANPEGTGAGMRHARAHSSASTSESPRCLRKASDSPSRPWRP